MEKTSGFRASILTCYYRPKPGGLCKRLFRAIRALLESGHEVHYLAVVPFPIDHSKCHFHRYPWPESKTDGIVFWAIFHLAAPIMLLYLGLRHRVSHCFAFGTSYGFMLQPLRLLKKIPLTLFLRADSVENHRLKGRPGLLLKLEKLIEGLALAGSRFYGVSRHLTKTVCTRHRRLCPSKFGTLPNDIEAAIPGMQTAPKLPLRIGCVGILEARKNQAMAISCMRQLSARQARLCVFGNGPEENSLRELVRRLEVEDRVNFAGWVDSPARIWAEIDLLVFPSRHEGSPNAVLEALAYGVPVLASDIPEHREILDLGSLLPADDDGAWSEKIKKILMQPSESLMSLRRQQQQYAEELRFDWEAEILKRILE
jgi:glycosyltransferase involved in cell wall biosynthesis